MNKQEQRALKQTVSSKLVKTRLLLEGGGELARRVPRTAALSRERLRAMLQAYGMVYVKPDTGSQGIGVCRVERDAGGGYRCQTGTRRLRLGSYDAMYRSLLRQAGGRRHLVQQGIHSLRYRGRAFDFRIMVQKSPAGKWENTGIAARVAHPAKIVSNGSQGGTIYDAGRLLGLVAGRRQAMKLLGRMNGLALLAAARFGASYPAMNELGIDVAVDHRLEPWILEVNTRPDPCPFAKLEDRTALRTIIRYARAYGRRYCLKCGKAKKGSGI